MQAYHWRRLVFASTVVQYEGIPRCCTVETLRSDTEASCKLTGGSRHLHIPAELGKRPNRRHLVPACSIRMPAQDKLNSQRVDSSSLSTSGFLFLPCLNVSILDPNFIDDTCAFTIDLPYSNPSLNLILLVFRRAAMMTPPKPAADVLHLISIAGAVIFLLILPVKLWNLRSSGIRSALSWKGRFKAVSILVSLPNRET